MFGDATHIQPFDGADDDVEYHKSHAPSPPVESKIKRTATLMDQYSPPTPLSPQRELSPPLHQREQHPTDQQRELLPSPAQSVSISRTTPSSSSDPTTSPHVLTPPAPEPPSAQSVQREMSQNMTQTVQELTKDKTQTVQSPIPISSSSRPKRDRKPVIRTTASTLGNIEDGPSLNMLIQQQPQSDFITPSVPATVALWFTSLGLP